MLLTVSCRVWVLRFSLLFLISAAVWGYIYGEGLGQVMTSKQNVTGFICLLVVHGGVKTVKAKYSFSRVQ